MKHIFILLSFPFCLFSSLLAQNPYVELSYPWLNLQQVKDQKIKSIRLASVNDENITTGAPILLFFNESGMVVKEETLSGFRNESVYQYDEKGLLKMVIIAYADYSDTVDYYFDKKSNTMISQYVTDDSEGVLSISEAHYIYSVGNKLLTIKNFSGSATSLAGIGKNVLQLNSTLKYSYSAEKVISSNESTTNTYVYDAAGNLETFTYTDSLDGNSKEYSYSYDQNSRLVLINLVANGKSTKTFVTYEFYE